MNLGILPLLIVALLMAAGDGGVDTVQLVLSGVHDLEERPGAVVVADAVVSVPDDVEVPGPLYVIGGEVIVTGRVAGDLVQLAGTVRIEQQGTVEGELRHLGGTQVVAPGATVGERTSLAVATPTRGGPSGVVVTVLIALTLAVAAVRLQRTRASALANVADAARGHPVVTLTVGALSALTGVAVAVFMAFTLLLLPVALLGLGVGVVATAYGVIALGQLVADRLPVRTPAMAAGLGVFAVVVAIQVVARLPVLGDVVALAILLTGLGAVLVTYFGATRLRLDALPD